MINQKWLNLSNKSNIREIYEGEMFIRTQSAILLQIFHEFMISSKINFKSIVGPDDTCQGDL